MLLRLSVGTMVSVTALACGSPGGDVDALATSHWRLHSSPSWIVGDDAADTTLQFTEIQSVAFLNDTLVLIGHSRHPPAVFLIRGDGQLLRTLGREGSGPGELGTVHGVWGVPPDTVIAYDFWSQRLTWYTTDGATVGTQRITDMAFLGDQFGLRGRFADGSYLARRNALWEGVTGSAGRAKKAAVRVRASGSVIDTIGVFPDVDFKENARGRPAAPHFGSRAAYLAKGDRYWTGFPDSFTIREYDLAGNLLQTFHRPSRPRQVTPLMVSRLRAQQLDVIPRGVSYEGMAEYFDSRPVADVTPRFGSRLILAPDGSLWVPGYVTPMDSTVRWTVFRADGTVGAELVAPADIDIRDVGRTGVVAVMTDDLGVPMVARYEIDRPQR